MPRSEPHFFDYRGASCARQFITFEDLTEKLKMDPHLVRQCNGHAAPSRALVKGLAKELGIDLQFLEKLADEVRWDLGAKRKPARLNSRNKTPRVSQALEEEVGIHR